MSSSSPSVELLPTPTTKEHNGPGRPDGPRNDTLRARIAMLPTPLARDSSMGYEDGLPAVAKLLKTPTAQLAVNGGSQHPDKRKAGNHGPTLADEVEFLLPDGAGAKKLLPTPTASPYGSNQSDSPGATIRPSLDSLAPKLLPTPTVADSRGTRNATAGRTTDNPKIHLAYTLTDVTYAGKIGSPSAPPACAPSTSTTPGDSAPVASAASIPSSGGPESASTTARSARRKLLPTPRASDGDKGSPNQHGGRGDLTLASAAARILPTPTAADAVRSSPTYARGNPTLSGAITNPPSAGGSPSSDDVPPGQLMIEVA
ncbi:hypothetical protein [Streptomyces sp. enrichment culture]|uniref:hypothetical protein n=1 Tax=Streptomyces sp. enrichment culture TaxID=1795815 RepID=UPI003F55AD14